MFGHFRHYLDHYLAPHPTREVKEIYLSTAILNFAVAAVMVFEPVYLYSAGFSIAHILLFYAAVYVAYFLVLPLGGRICRKHGFEHTILWSSPFLILYYLALFAVGFDRWFIVAAGVAIVIQKVLYWPSYHSNFAAWSRRGETGREIADLSALVALVTALAPFLGGLVIVTFGFKPLFAAVAVLILLSNLPLLRTPELFFPTGFSYVGALRRLVARENRRRAVGFLGFGEELIALGIWPLFIATLLKSPFSLGIVMSLSMGFTILVTLYVGRITDEGGEQAVLRNGAFFVAASWLARLIVAGPFGIFLIDSFYRVAKHMVGVPLLTEIYDGARGAETEEVVFFEMALAVGKASAAIVGWLAFSRLSNPWPVMFILSAAFAALYAFGSRGPARRQPLGETPVDATSLNQTSLPHA